MPYGDRHRRSQIYESARHTASDTPLGFRLVVSCLQGLLRRYMTQHKPSSYASFAAISWRHHASSISSTIYSRLPMHHFTRVI
jgi:hypothetical protein